MVTKNVLAVLVVVVLLVSVAGTMMNLIEVGEPGTESGKGEVRVNVVEKPLPPTALVTLNVVEKEVNNG
jgi:hypothetical protein